MIFRELRKTLYNLYENKGNGLLKEKINLPFNRESDVTTSTSVARLRYCLWSFSAVKLKDLFGFEIRRRWKLTERTIQGWQARTAWVCNTMVMSKTATTKNSYKNCLKFIEHLRIL